MKKYILVIILLSTGVLNFVACNSPSNNDALIPTYVAETAAARQAATAVIENALAVVLTGSAPPPTLTPTPTATATPTATPTPSPTPNPTAEIIVGLAQIRAGPSIAYKVIRNAALGDTFEVVGRSADGRWIVVSLVLDQIGWLFAEQVQEIVNVEGLTIVEAPPTPVTEVTITIVNNLSQGQIYFWIIGIHNTSIKITKGETYSIKLLPGEYKFNYGTVAFGTITCSKTFNLNFSIYWDPPNNGNSFCASFP